MVVSFVVQNPVNSVVWLTAMMQLLVIPVSFMLDVRPFCEAPLRCKPFMFLTATFYILTFLAITTGPAHKANIFQLYLFPEVFRLGQVGVLVAAAVAFVLTNTVAKHGLQRRKQRRLAPR